MIDTSEIGSEVFIGIEAKGLSNRYTLDVCMFIFVVLKVRFFQTSKAHLSFTSQRFKVVINNCWATPSPYSTDRKRWSLIINRY